MDLLVELLERRQDGVPVVDEVEDERPLLARRTAVVPRECLHRLNPSDALVHVHRDELRLVEARLVLVGDDEHVVVGPSNRSGSSDSLMPRFIPGSVYVTPRSLSRTSPEKATRQATSP